MNFTRDFLNEVLICRDSIKVLLNEGTELTINAGDKFTRINDIVSVRENYGEEIEELEERVQIKRKYGQHDSMAVNSSAPIRDRIVEFVGKKFCNEEELQNFLLKLEEDRGTSFNQKQWFDRNQKYFQSFKNEGQKVWTLSKFGKRILEHILKNKSQKKPMVNESKIGLFKFNTINKDVISESRIVYPEEQIKKECISRLSDFFRVPANALTKFKFDGNDNIKELTKALTSTSEEGTAQYYKVAIMMAKRDLGL
jgi:hypothetical protein